MQPGAVTSRSTQRDDAVANDVSRTKPRVLIALGTDGEWARGILRGFTAVAHELDWAVLHHHPATNLSWLLDDQGPMVAVIGPEVPEALARLAPAAVVSLTVDRSARGVASVCLDEKKIAALAFEHLVATGSRHVTTFRYDASPFALAREAAFMARARAAGIPFCPGWGGAGHGPSAHLEDPAAMTAWLRALPKPCGIFTCADGWARPVARYAREAGLRVPEELALIGVGNDELECGLVLPPLSSVIIPWQEVGRKAAALVQLALAQQCIAGKRVVVPPFAVAPRRSSDPQAIGDRLVARALMWIRERAQQRMSAAMLARAVGISRQQLERRFRRALDRTIDEEIERVRIAAVS